MNFGCGYLSEMMIIYLSWQQLKKKNRYIINNNLKF